MAIEPTRFFEEILPALARTNAAQFPALAATAVIAVGTRAWTCTLHDVERPVQRGVDVARAFARDRAATSAAPEAVRRVTTKRTRAAQAHHERARAATEGRATFSLWLDERAFTELVSGAYERDDEALTRAIDERRVGFRGDLAWLAQLGRLLAGATTTAHPGLRRPHERAR